MVYPLKFLSSRLALAVAVSFAGVSAAAADGRLDAQYRATIAGLPIGGGTWTIDIGEDQYSMALTGQAAGLLKAFSSGDGTGTVRGTIQGGRAQTAAYAVTIKTRNKVEDVRMALAGGGVKDLSIKPPPDPDPDRIPLTEAHKRGVTDLFTATLLPMPAAGGLGPEVCQRTLPVFDGRIRFDLALSFKRMDKVKAEHGYEGPVVVCAVAFRPLAGYERDRAGINFLKEARDIEMWFAPIAGTRFMTVYRLALPTMLGTAVLEATRFVTAPKAAPAGAASVKTQ
jgi:hypothetical protein